MLPNAKHLALLAYLKLEPGSYPREQLTSFVWSSGEASSLNDAVSSLRSIFGKEVFPYRTQRIQFDPSLVDCDATDLLAARDSQEALQLYRGPFLDGFNERGASSRFCRWVEKKRAELQAVFLGLCEAECVRAAEENRWEDVRAIAEQGVRLVPAWEAGNRWLEEYRSRTRRPPSALQSPTLPPLEPVAAPALVPEPPKPRSRRFLKWVIGLMVGIIGLAGVVLFWRGSHTSKPVLPAASRASNRSAPVCAPGLAEVTLVRQAYAYDARVRPGAAFTQKWTLLNTGACTWPTDLQLRYAGASDTLSFVQAPVPLTRPVPPGESYEIGVSMHAPGAPAHYEEHWRLIDARAPAAKIRGASELVARIFVPQDTYPVCGPGQAQAALDAKRLSENAEVLPGRPLTWSWSVRNTGSCMWDADTRLVHVSHGSNGRLTTTDVSPAPPHPIGPRQIFTFQVPTRVPSLPGAYGEEWELRDASGKAVPLAGGSRARLLVQVPEDTATRVAAPICRPGQAKLGFVTEQYPDESIIPAGATFLKRWTLVNESTCTLDPRIRLEYQSNSGKQLALTRAPVFVREYVPFNATYTFEVPMRAPSQAGSFREDWRVVEPSGATIHVGNSATLWAKIVVAR